MTAYPKTIAGARLVRAGLAGLGLGLLLTACAEPEVILPGKREGIRSVLQTEPVEAAPERVENTSRAIALAAQTNNADWAQAPGTQQFRVAHAALATAPQRVWSVGIGAGDSRRQRITANPVVADGRIFTLDAGTTVTATATSGAVLWSRDIKPPRDADGQATGGGLAAAGGRVYASIGYGALVALDAATGAELWTQQLDATGSGTPMVAGNLVYLTAGDDTGWAVRAEDGRVAWQLGASSDIDNVLGAPPPVLAGDLVIFGFGSGEVQAAFRQGGLRRWDASVLGQRFGRALGNVGDVTGSPVVVGDTVFVGNQSGRIVALHAQSGKRVWTAPEGTVGPAFPAGDSIFVVSDLNELLRLDAADGSRVWGVPLPNFVKEKPRKRGEVFAHYGPILGRGLIRVASNDGVLRSFDPRDGSLVGTVEIPGGATTAPVVAGGVLYVVSANGQLHAFR